MEVLKKAIDEMQKDVTGSVRLKLYKGNCIVMVEVGEITLPWRHLHF